MRNAIKNYKGSKKCDHKIKDYSQCSIYWIPQQTVINNFSYFNLFLILVTTIQLFCLHKIKKLNYNKTPITFYRTFPL